MDRPYHCDQCPKTFQTYFGLRSHVGQQHKTTIDPKCDICGETFMHRIQLSRHKNKMHLEEKVERGHVKNTVKCGECGGFVSTIVELCNHLKDVHNLDIQVQEMFFETKAEFDAWRKACEVDKRFEFRQTRGRRPKKTGHETIYLYCHRSGCFHSDSRGVRAPRKTNRINFHCCAFAIAQISEKGFKVKTCLDHYGHDNHLLRLRISKETKEKIYQYIREGRSFEWIQGKLRENIMQKTEDGSFVALRENLIKRQDIFNILSQMRQRALIEGTDDAQYVDLWKAANMNIRNSGLKQTSSAEQYFVSSAEQDVIMNDDTAETAEETAGTETTPLVPAAVLLSASSNAEITVTAQVTVTGGTPLLSTDNTTEVISTQTPSIASDIWDALKTRSIKDPVIAEQILRKTKEIELLYDLAEKKEAARTISSLKQQKRQTGSLKQNVVSLYNAQELEAQQRGRTVQQVFKRSSDMSIEQEDAEDEVGSRQLKEFFEKHGYLINA